MISDKDYKVMNNFFNNHIFQVYECIEIKSLKPLNAWASNEEKRVFNTIRQNYLYDLEIIKFNSLLIGDFYLSKCYSLTTKTPYWVINK